MGEHLFGNVGRKFLRPNSAREAIGPCNRPGVLWPEVRSRAQAAGSDQLRDAEARYRVQVVCGYALSLVRGAESVGGER
jgi:hypothetical protein